MSTISGGQCSHRDTVRVRSSAGARDMSRHGGRIATTDAGTTISDARTTIPVEHRFLSSSLNAAATPGRGLWCRHAANCLRHAHLPDSPPQVVTTDAPVSSRIYRSHGRGARRERVLLDQYRPGPGRVRSSDRTAQRARLL
ncbi:hypothetical protein K466DRAFT_668248, partial [Polyporus arcularius HHB13444]